MTFDEWFLENAKYMRTGDFEIWLSEAWDAAVLAEREACAKVVEAGVLGHGECAAAIRARGEK